MTGITEGSPLYTTPPSDLEMANPCVLCSKVGLTLKRGWAYQFSDGYTEGVSTPLHLAGMNATGSSTSKLRALVGGVLTSIHRRIAGGRHCTCRFADSAEAVEILLRASACESLPDAGGKTATDMVGFTNMSVRNLLNIEGKKRLTAQTAQRTNRMLERAPADRAWRHRGWLVPSRSYPIRAQIVDNRNNSTRSAKELRSKDEGSGWSARNGVNADLGRLVGTLVGLELEGLFRLATSFL